MRNACTVACCQRNSLLVFGLTGFYILYLLVGAALFSSFEKNKQAQVIKQYQDAKKHFSNEYRISEDKLNDFLKQVIDITSRGLNATSDDIQTNWGFTRSLFFTSTLITTVGYGQVIPSNDGTKILCIVYAALGIPLTIIVFSAIVERMLYITYRSSAAILNPRGFSENHVRLFLFCGSLLFVAVFFFVIPTAVFYYIEKDWSLLDAVYYCFISLSTIGLGDLVPGVGTRGRARVPYDLFVSAYVVIGVLFMTFLVTVTATVPYFNLGKFYQLNLEFASIETEGLIRHSSIVRAAQESVRTNVQADAAPNHANIEEVGEQEESTD